MTMTDWRMIKLDSNDFKAVMFALEVAAHAAGDQRTTAGMDFLDLIDELQGQWDRNADQWGWPEEDSEENTATLEGSTYQVSEDDFFDLGARARELQRERAITAAKECREDKLMKGTITAFISNDPIDW